MFPLRKIFTFSPYLTRAGRRSWPGWSWPLHCIRVTFRTWLEQALAAAHGSLTSSLWGRVARNLIVQRNGMGSLGVTVRRDFTDHKCWEKQSTTSIGNVTAVALRNRRGLLAGAQGHTAALLLWARAQWEELSPGLLLVEESLFRKLPGMVLTEFTCKCRELDPSRN